MGHLNGRTTLARGLGQAIVAGVTVDLQDAIKAGQEGFGILAPAAGGVKVDHAGRILAAPRSVITGQRPKVACFCHPAPRVQHRGGGFVHEQLTRSLQMLGQPIDDGLQVERSLANPISQNGAVQIKTRPRQDLALTIERQMICIFADQHMGERRFRRQPAYDQMGGRWRLGHPVGASPAGIFRAHGDDDAELGGDDVQPLCAVFADLVQDAAATRAHQAVRFDDLFNARQRGRQIADGALCDRLGCRSVTWWLGRAGFLFRLNLGQGNRQILKGQLPLILGQLF